MSGTSYRVDETYIKVGKTCAYLYRAVDKEVVAHPRERASAQLYSGRNKRKQMSCIRSHLENDTVLRTKRPRRWRKVLFHRSTCALSPESFPHAVCCSSAITVCYASQKSL